MARGHQLGIMREASTSGEDHGHNGDCAGNSCCVFPIILAFMVGAFLRQMFHWFRSHYISGIPPYTVCLIVAGAGFAVAVHYESFTILHPYKQCLRVQGKTILHATLPLLVFQPTFTTEMQTFKKSINQVLLLAVTGYAIMIVMTAMVVKWLFYQDWNHYVCVIFGIVVCATDPLAVDDVVKVSGVSGNLAALLQGESIIGGAMGMAFFRLFRLLLHSVSFPEYFGAVFGREITILVVESMFAPITGIFTAILTVFWLSRIFNDAILEITIVLSVVHLAYYISEMLRMPGMLTVLFFGLYLSSSRASISHTVESTMKKLFRLLTDIYDSTVYFYAGAFIVNEGLLNISVKHFLYDLALWLVVNVLRAMMVFFMSPVLRRLGLGMSWEHTLTVWIAGLNGSFNILFAMMATQDISMAVKPEIGNTFFQSAIIILFIKQLINTSTTRIVLRAFGLRSMPKFHQMSLANAMRMLNVARAQTINSLKSDRFMADAAFDIVEAETNTDEMFRSFSHRRFNMSTLFKRLQMANNVVEPAEQETTRSSFDNCRENKAESIQMLLKAQKKTYWQIFDRGLVSKEAFHQLIEWADSAGDHKGKYLDVRRVKKASQVRPILKTLKRQVKMKLRQLKGQAEDLRGWQYWQQLVLPMVLGYGFHVVDTLAIFLAMAVDLYDFEDGKMHNKFVMAITIWNGVVVGLYCMIALGELLVMRLRFFKIVWHDITLLIVLMGFLDMLVMMSVGNPAEIQGQPSYIGRLYIRLSFILSRSVRLLGMVENVPWMLRKLEVQLEKRISGHLGVGFDICCAYVTGQSEVVGQLDSLIHDHDVALDLKRHCNRSKLDIIRTLGILALESPTIALSVKTRQAIRIVLNAQHDSVKQLKEEGVLQETDAALLIKDLEERMKKLLNSPPMVENNTEENIVRNVAWVQGDDKLYDYLKEHMEIWKLKANAVITEQESEDYNIYIIVSGVARLERMTGAFNVSVIDFMTAGNVLGEVHFLTKSVRHKTIRCETAVSLMILKEEVMERALSMDWNPELPPLIYRMWLVVAKRVAIRVMMEDPEFQNMSHEHLKMQMYYGYLMDSHLGTSITLHDDPSDNVVLIHGNARDAFTKQPFKGPCTIPRTCFRLQLLPEEGLYPLVFIVPSGPVEMGNYSLQPMCSPSNINSSVLAMSGSAMALRLEDLINDNTRMTESEPDKTDELKNARACAMMDMETSESESTIARGSDSLSSVLAPTTDAAGNILGPTAHVSREFDPPLDREGARISHMSDNLDWDMMDDEEWFLRHKNQIMASKDRSSDSESEGTV